MEALLRLGIFVGVFGGMALLELWQPRRPLSQSKAWRWRINLGLTVLDTLIVRFTVGAVAVGAAALAQRRGWGVLTLLQMPPWANIVLSLLILDVAIYAQHVVFHRVPMFWRLHKVHHTDIDVDVTTGVRFHPIEILLSMLYKALLVLLLGCHAAAVIAFEVLLNATAQFNHSNIAIPARLERVLRILLMTPDLHRIHHSVAVDETNSNYGFSVPYWDRLCRTYRDQPRVPHQSMPLGLAAYRDPEPVGLWRLLLLPCRNEVPQASPGDV